MWAGSQGYTYTLKEGPNTLNVNLTSFLDSDLKVGIKIEYYSTYKEVYGENYPGINGHRTLDINLPHTFPVFEGYIKANLIPE